MSVSVPEPEPEIRIFVVSPMRIYQQGLSYVLAQEPAIRVVGMASSLRAAGLAPDGDGTAGSADVLLFDLAVEGGLAELRRLAGAGSPKVLALGVVEDEDQVIACAEAGIAGYVTPSGSVGELVRTIRAAARGEFNCPPHIAAGLLRRLATAGAHARPQARLTLREREVARLIDQGLSNKEIARRLSIELATVKNHVHNILEKLGVSRRADAVASLRAAQTL
jgi:two-component system, NarL family, nitrate/nitrite response regulator NarL